MMKNKPFLDLNKLANQLNLSHKTISQVINQHFAKSFYDFVNSYLCDEVKKLLTKEGDPITIMEAMYAAGFNSKSSFNKEFKKLTGQTPSEYKKSLHK